MIWELHVTDQIVSFFVFITVGMSVTVIYDFFRGMRRAGALRSFLATFFSDVIFWCISAVLTFTAMLVFTEGVVRSYAVIGMFFGTFIQNKLFSRYSVKIFSCFVRAVLKVTRFSGKKYKKVISFLNFWLDKLIKRLKPHKKVKKTLETVPYISV